VRLTKDFASTSIKPLLDHTAGGLRIQGNVPQSSGLLVCVMIPQSGAAMRPHAVGLKIRSSLQLYGSFECLKSISDFYASMATDLTNATLIDSLARGMLKHSGAKFLWLVQRKEKTCYCRMRSWRVICCEHKAEPTKLKPGPIGLQKSQSPRNCSGSLSRRLANCTSDYCRSRVFAKLGDPDAKTRVRNRSGPTMRF
jgi:hypothetical protein